MCTQIYPVMNLAFFMMCQIASYRNKADRHKSRAPCNQRQTKRLIELRARN